MTWNYRHILNGLLASLCVLWFVACEKPAVYRITPSDNVYLSFSPVLVDEAGNGGTAGAGMCQATPLAAVNPEGLHVLRVVIVSEDLDEDGNPTGNHTVEVNEVYQTSITLDGGALTFPIQDGRKKRIYLLGNVDGIHTVTNAAGETVDLNEPTLYKPGSDGVTPIEECRFTWTAAEQPDYIPVTAVYEVEIPEKNQLTLIDGAYYYGMKDTLYLIRAVTKFSITYVNGTAAIGAPTNYRLRAWGLSQVADGPSYLLAKVADNWEESTQPATDYTTLNLPYTPYWPRWLADEAEKTQLGADPAQYEWMTAYDLPQPNHKDGLYTYEDDYKYNIMATAGGAGATSLKQVYYLPESKYVPSGSSEQQYGLEFHFWEWVDNPSNRSEIVYTAELPNCRSLFRNTEIKLTVTIQGEAVSLQATVCPWTEHTIDIPAFE